MNEKISVLVVDDSPTKRSILKQIIEEKENIKVIDVARNGEEAILKAKNLKPDVITMDLNMPILSGVEATKKIMQDNPCPIVIISSEALADALSTMQALSYGALEFVSISEDISLWKENLIKNIKLAAKIKVIRYIDLQSKGKSYPLTEKKFATNIEILAIGVSTGGPVALKELLSGLPNDLPVGVIIIQHMIGGFTKGLAEWLNIQSPLHVKEAKRGDIINKGCVYIAPGDFHLVISKNKTIDLINISENDIYKPSIDKTFFSIAEIYGDKTLAIILTGMGRDGAQGTKAIKEKGGITFVQDESSCVVFGMPKAALELNCVDKVIPLSNLAKEIIFTLNSRKIK